MGCTWRTGGLIPQVPKTVLGYLGKSPLKGDGLQKERGREGREEKQWRGEREETGDWRGGGKLPQRQANGRGGVRSNTGGIGGGKWYSGIGC